MEGEAVIERVYLSTTTDTAFPVPTRDTYRFLGWFYKNDENVQVECYSPDMPEALALIAKWQYNTSPGDELDDIHVTFRLIGSTLSNGDVDLSIGDYKGAEYITWIPTTPYTMRIGDTMYELFVRVVEDAGLDEKGAKANYVTGIKGPDGAWLREMTNGQFSGWMYTVGKTSDATNQRHVDRGLQEYVLKDGDIVIWHYVNDWRYEVEDWFDDPGFPATATDGRFYNARLDCAGAAVRLS